MACIKCKHEKCKCPKGVNKFYNFHTAVTGEKGDNLEIRVEGVYLQVKYENEEEWRNVANLTEFNSNWEVGDSALTPKEQKAIILNSADGDKPSLVVPKGSMDINDTDGAIYHDEKGNLVFFNGKEEFNLNVPRVIIAEEGKAYPKGVEVIDFTSGQRFVSLEEGASASDLGKDVKEKIVIDLEDPYLITTTDIFNFLTSEKIQRFIDAGSNLEEVRKWKFLIHTSSPSRGQAKMPDGKTMMFSLPPNEVTLSPVFIDLKNIEEGDSALYLPDSLGEIRSGLTAELEGPNAVDIVNEYIGMFVPSLYESGFTEDIEAAVALTADLLSLMYLETLLRQIHSYTYSAGKTPLHSINSKMIADVGGGQTQTLFDFSCFMLPEGSPTGFFTSPYYLNSRLPLEYSHEVLDFLERGSLPFIMLHILGTPVDVCIHALSTKEFLDEMERQGMNADTKGEVIDFSSSLGLPCSLAPYIRVWDKSGTFSFVKKESDTSISMLKVTSPRLSAELEPLVEMEASLPSTKEVLESLDSLEVDFKWKPVGSSFPMDSSFIKKQGKMSLFGKIKGFLTQGNDTASLDFQRLGDPSLYEGIEVFQGSIGVGIEKNGDISSGISPTKVYTDNIPYSFSHFATVPNAKQSTFILGASLSQNKVLSSNPLVYSVTQGAHIVGTAYEGASNLSFQIADSDYPYQGIHEIVMDKGELKGSVRALGRESSSSAYGESTASFNVFRITSTNSGLIHAPFRNSFSLRRLVSNAEEAIAYTDSSYTTYPVPLRPLTRAEAIGSLVSYPLKVTKGVKLPSRLFWRSAERRTPNEIMLGMPRENAERLSYLQPADWASIRSSFEASSEAGFTEYFHLSGGLDWGTADNRGLYETYSTWSNFVYSQDQILSTVQSSTERSALYVQPSLTAMYYRKQSAANNTTTHLGEIEISSAGVVVSTTGMEFKHATALTSSGKSDAWIPSWKAVKDLNSASFTKTAAGAVPAPGGTTSTRYLREDGTWVVPTNTTYTVMTSAELLAGTATTTRLISAARFKEGVETWAPTTPAKFIALLETATPEEITSIKTLLGI